MLYARSLLFILALALIGLSGCFLLEDPGPSEARLVLDGEAGQQVDVVMSTRFIAQRQRRVDEETGATTDTTLISLLRADTLTLTLPYDETFDIRGDQRFMAEVARLNPEADKLHMKAWIDDNMWYDTAALPDQDTLRFVYYFQAGAQPLIVRF